MELNNELERELEQNYWSGNWSGNGSGNWNWKIFKGIGAGIGKKELKKKGIGAGIESKGIARNWSGIGIEWKELTPALMTSLTLSWWHVKYKKCDRTLTFFFIVIDIVTICDFWVLCHKNQHGHWTVELFPLALPLTLPGVGVTV